MSIPSFIKFGEAVTALNHKYSNLLKDLILYVIEDSLVQSLTFLGLKVGAGLQEEADSW